MIFLYIRVANSQGICEFDGLSSSGRRYSAGLESLGLTRPAPFLQQEGHGGRYQSIVCSASNGSSSCPKLDAAITNGSITNLDRVAVSAEQALKFKSLVSAEINPRTEQFFSSDVNGDPDRPSEGFASIMEAVEAIRQGKVCITEKNGLGLLCMDSKTDTYFDSFLILSQRFSS